MPASEAQDTRIMPDIAQAERHALLTLSAARWQGSPSAMERMMGYDESLQVRACACLELTTHARAPVVCIHIVQPSAAICGSNRASSARGVRIVVSFSLSSKPPSLSSCARDHSRRLLSSRRLVGSVLSSKPPHRQLRLVGRRSCAAACGLES